MHPYLPCLGYRIKEGSVYFYFPITQIQLLRTHIGCLNLLTTPGLRFPLDLSFPVQGHWFIGKALLICCQQRLPLSSNLLSLETHMLLKRCSRELLILFSNYISVYLEGRVSWRKEIQRYEESTINTFWSGAQNSTWNPAMVCLDFHFES